MRPDGSRVRRLTHDPASDRYPAWSPDGSQVVFSSERLTSAQELRAKRDGYAVAHLYVMRADGPHLRRLTLGARVDDFTPAWSPNGRLIAFSKGDDPPKLETVRPDGSARRDTGQTGAYPDWAPDGKLLAFLHIYYPDGFRNRPASPPPQQELALMLPSGAQIGSLGDHAEARWSPDGTQLASADGTVLDPSGSKVATIPSGDSSWQPLCTVSGDNRANVLRVRAAGALVLRARRTRPHRRDARRRPAVRRCRRRHDRRPERTFRRDRLRPWNRHRARRPGRPRRRRLRTGVAMRKVAFAVGLLLVAATPATADFHAVNGRIAYERVGHIWLTNQDGSDQRDVAAGNQPAWSADGTRIAYVESQFSSPVGELRVMNADGSGQRTVDDDLGPSITTPSWSPDGTQIVVAAYGDLYAVPVAGGRSRLVARTARIRPGRPTGV